MSALTGEQGIVTIESLNPESPPSIDSLIDSLSHAHGSPVTVNSHRRVAHGIVADIPQAIADKILAAVSAGQSTHVPIKALTHLPEEFWSSTRRFEGFQRGGGRGGRGGSGGRGGRSGGYGRDDRSGGYGRYSNRSSDSGSRGGNRYDSRGDSRGGYGAARPAVRSQW